MKIDGGCHCGHIRYEAQIDPEQVLVCHCTDCQTLSGSAYRTVVFVEERSFTLLAGTPKIYVKTTADSGRPREQTFCPECGSPLYSTSVGDGPKTLGLRVGTARQRDRMRPKAQYYCHSALDWVDDLAAVPRVV
jgi:hypothetical protein